MPRLDWYALAMHRSAQLHQAAAIVGDQRIGAAFLEPFDFVLRHRQRNMREFDGEHPAESAAFLRIAEFDQLEFADRRQQNAWLVTNSQFTRQMAGRMIC